MGAESGLKWLEEAKRNLSSAENDLHPEVAYASALLAGELALKAVLVKLDAFEEKDKHHDMLKLFRKIRQNTRALDRAEDIVTDLSYVDLTNYDETMHVNCAFAMTPQIRYSQEGTLPYEYIHIRDATEKIELVKRLIFEIENCWDAIKRM